MRHSARLVQSFDKRNKTGFLNKAYTLFARVGVATLYTVLVMVHIIISKSTPILIKSLMLVALLYYLFPFDLILDFIPIIGHIDDFIIIITSLIISIPYATQTIRSRARTQLLMLGVKSIRYTFVVDNFIRKTRKILLRKQ